MRMRRSQGMYRYVTAAQSQRFHDDGTMNREINVRGAEDGSRGGAMRCSIQGSGPLRY